MKAEIDKLTQQIADCEAARARLQLLKPLYERKARSKLDYQAKRSALVDRWQQWRCEILHLAKQVKAEPNWHAVVDAGVCSRLKAIKDEKAHVDELQRQLVLLQASFDVVVTVVKKADADKADADKLQHASLEISSSLDKRLTDFGTRLKALKASAVPILNPVNLYALFYDLLPDLLAIAPTDAPNAADVKELSDLQGELPCPPETKPPPQLVAVDALSAAQDTAWADYVVAAAALDTAKQAVIDKSKELEAAQAQLDADIASLTTQPSPPRPQPVAA